MLRISTAAPGKEGSADLMLPAPPALAATAKPAGVTNMLTGAQPEVSKGLSQNTLTTAGLTTDGVVTSGVDHPLQTGPSISDNSVPATTATPTAPVISAVDREVGEEAPATDVPAAVTTGAPGT